MTFMSTIRKITVERLYEVLEVCFETSTLIWKKRGIPWWDTRYAGKEAFTLLSRRYFVGTVDKVRLFKHRVLWAMKYGRWPEELDHINRNPQDNSLANLREVTRSGNQKNMSRMSSNTSGRTGVSYHKRDGVWRSYIGEGGSIRYLGSFKIYDEAVLARESAEKNLGYFTHGDR